MKRKIQTHSVLSGHKNSDTNKLNFVYIADYKLVIA